MMTILKVNHFDLFVIKTKEMVRFFFIANIWTDDRSGFGIAARTEKLDLQISQIILFGIWAHWLLNVCF